MPYLQNNPFSGASYGAMFPRKPPSPFGGAPSYLGGRTSQVPNYLTGEGYPVPGQGTTGRARVVGDKIYGPDGSVQSLQDAMLAWRRERQNRGQRGSGGFDPNDPEFMAWLNNQQAAQPTPVTGYSTSYL